MTAPHRTAPYLKFAAAQRKRLQAALPAPCHLCGGMIQRSDPVDLDHLVPVSTDPSGLLNPGNVRLAHRACNRRAGQKITTTRRRTKRNAARRPEW